MGVINLQLQNNAILLRWLWRLYAKEKKLWASYAAMLYAIKPSRDGPLFLSSSGSFFWRSLLKLRTIFSSSTSFNISSGKRVSFWFDSWSGQPLAATTQRALPYRFISLSEASQRRDHLFQRPHTLQQCLVLQKLAYLVLGRDDDEFTWKLSASGKFSVKSIYDTMGQAGKLRTRTMDIWKTAVTPSMKLFFFLTINKRILTHDVMIRRNLQHESGCVMCNREHLEDNIHLFFTCRYAKLVWLSLSNSMTTNFHIADSILDIYLEATPSSVILRRPWTTRFITALWFIWRERNERTFRGNMIPASVLASKIRTEADLLLKHC